MTDAIRRARALFAVYTVGVLILMFAPVPAAPDSVPHHGDKVVHAVAFFGFAALLYRERLVSRQVRPRVIAGIAIATAFVVEGVQFLLPYRSGDGWDGIAGGVGALVGVMFARACTAQPRA